jgi:hypothetical protein
LLLPLVAARIRTGVEAHVDVERQVAVVGRQRWQEVAGGGQATTAWPHARGRTGWDTWLLGAGWLTSGPSAASYIIKD